MPGALTNPMMNPQQSYMDYTHDYDPASYAAQAAKGFNWTGTTWAPNAQGAGGGQTDPLKAGYSAANLFTGGGGGGGGIAGPGGGGFGGSSSMFGGTSFGGSNPFATDAAAKKLRDEFARMKKARGGAINEDLGARGIFSSGVGSSLMNDAMTQLDLQEGAGLESLFNNAGQQQLAFQLEQQRMQNEMMRNRYGQGGQRFGNANQNQGMMDYYNSKDQQNAGQYGGPQQQQWMGNLGQMFGGGGGPDTGLGMVPQGFIDQFGGAGQGGGSMPYPLSTGQSSAYEGSPWTRITRGRSNRSPSWETSKSGSRGVRRSNTIRVNSRTCSPHATSTVRRTATSKRVTASLRCSLR